MATRPPYVEPKLLPFQEFCRDFIISHPKCGLFLPMGAGKTLTTLSALARINPSGHVLVIAPKNIARSVWLDEIKKWNIPFRVKSFIVESDPSSKRYEKKLTTKTRLKRYQDVVTDPPTIYFINRELVKDLVDHMPIVNGRPVWYFPNVIIDESQSFKNPSSVRFKALDYVRQCIFRMIILTGTPTPEGLTDLWSQIYLLDGGERLGRTVSQYRCDYFRPTVYVKNRPVSWEPLPGAEERIYDRIRDIVVSIKNPNVTIPSIKNDFIVHLDPDEMALYKTLARQSVLECPDWKTVAVNRGVLSAKLTQLASGTLYTQPPDPTAVVNDAGNSNTAASPVQSAPAAQAPAQKPSPMQQLNPLKLFPIKTVIGKTRDVPEFCIAHYNKLEACKYIIDNAGDNVIVAYKFKSDREMLRTYLPGSEVFDGSPDMIRRWNAGQIPILLLQPASAGHGLNLQQGGHTLIWYTIPNNLEHYLQTNARIDRQGQKNPVIIHHLITEHTVDLHNMALLRRKTDMEQRLIDAVDAGLPAAPSPVSKTEEEIEAIQDALDFVFNEKDT